MSQRTVAEELTLAAESLEPVTETPRLDAEILLAHAVGLSRARLLSRLHETLPQRSFPEYLERRLKYEPIAYILGEWEFFSIPVYVERPILVPRPETEHLVEAVLAESPWTVADVCTGTGCVAIAVAKQLRNTRVLATDRNPQAVALARKNVARHRLESRLEVFEGDLLEPVRDLAPFDVICANPPYVEDGAWETLSPNITDYEDPGALLAGPDGLDVIRRLISDALPLLSPTGVLALEIGMGQYEAVTGLLGDAGYRHLAVIHDLACIPRIVTGRRGLS